MSTPPVHREPSAAARWSQERRRRAIPQEVLDAAPEPRPGLDVGRFARRADRAMTEDTPSVRLAREAVPDGGAVLDVGCGGGAASLPLAPPAGFLVGFDGRADMLAAFAGRAEARGVVHQEIEGRWPEDADLAPPADVVVSHNVLYGIDDLVPFVQAMTAHARRRVVVQIPVHPPRSWMAPYWHALHGLTVPPTPTADDAAAVIREAGIDVGVQRWGHETHSVAPGDESVEDLRRQLCVGADRDEEIRDLMARHPPPATRPTVTLWWDTGGADRQVAPRERR